MSERLGGGARQRPSVAYVTATMDDRRPGHMHSNLISDGDVDLEIANHVGKHDLPRRHFGEKVLGLINSVEIYQVSSHQLSLSGSDHHSHIKYAHTMPENAEVRKCDRVTSGPLPSCGEETTRGQRLPSILRSSFVDAKQWRVGRVDIF